MIPALLASRIEALDTCSNPVPVSFEAVKKEASASGVPYQRLLNRILKESLASKKSTESRMDRIERELREVKRRLAA